MPSIHDARPDHARGVTRAALPIVLGLLSLGAAGCSDPEPDHGWSYDTSKRPAYTKKRGDRRRHKLLDLPPEERENEF